MLLMSLIIAVLALGANGRAGREAGVTRARSWSAVAAQATDDSGSVDDTLFVLGGIRLDADSGSVRARLGKPRRRSVSDEREGLGYVFTTWTYPHLEVTFADDKVAYVTCSSGDCSLPFGIRLGTTRVEVERLLGSPITPSAVDRPGVAKYVGRRTDCGITIEYVADRVKILKLWCDYT